MMRLFKLDNSEETNKTAPVLLEVGFDLDLANHQYTHIKDFSWGGAFHGVDVQRIRETCWLGHADKEKFGDYTAIEFVARFKSEFEKQYRTPDAKSVVTDLYFIGCEVGLLDRGAAYAQAAADGLYAAGFKNVRVHAVASPPQKEMAMVVKIETTANYGKTYSGQVRAMLLTREQEKKYNEILAWIQALPKELYSISIERSYRDQLRAIEEKAITFLDTLDIKFELDRPHNTFIPRQIMSRDHNRPQKNLAQEKALCQIEALMRDIAFSEATESKLEQQIKKFVAKLKINTSVDLDKLKALRNVVANCIDSHWIGDINEAKKKFKAGGKIREKLDQICTEINKLTSASSSLSAAVAASSNGSFFSQSITAIQRTADNVSARVAGVFQKAPPEMPNEIKIVIVRIEGLAGRLETEARGAWFTQDLKGYKAKKLHELVMAIKTDFQSQPSTPEWRTLINIAMKDKRLVQGVFSHRVWDLLNSILLTSRPTERTLLLN